MIIYIDENLPAQLAEGLNILQEPENRKQNENEPIEVKSIKKIFGQGAKDEDWIPQAGEQSACVITQDYNIKKTRQQWMLCEQHGLGIIFIKSPSGGLNYWQMVELLVKHWQEIVKVAAREKRPFGYKFSPRSHKLERM
jgi:hypothetical protein